MRILASSDENILTLPELEVLEILSWGLVIARVVPSAESLVL
jgi:hypothetical protein